MKAARSLEVLAALLHEAHLLTPDQRRALAENVEIEFRAELARRWAAAPERTIRNVMRTLAARTIPVDMRASLFCALPPAAQERIRSAHAAELERRASDASATPGR